MSLGPYKKEIKRARKHVERRLREQNTTVDTPSMMKMIAGNMSTDSLRYVLDNKQLFFDNWLDVVEKEWVERTLLTDT